MTKVSPILAKLQQQTTLYNVNKTKNGTDYNELYNNLQQHANDVKPNDARAIFVDENCIQSAINGIKDLGGDIKNVGKAVKTGKLDDHHLGRINDLGMIGGMGLIATFLASKATTKTATIMEYIGAGTFLASMKLWPKLFINLPARIVHGFNIDDKYISTQGAKKDFFLDNQFIPWDCYPEDKLRANAKRAGIDYDSKNGKEKIQRKMQKTACQNRTLWMATAGFATPLMTSLAGDFVTPKIENAVINSRYNKAKNIILGDGTFRKYIETSPVLAKHEKEFSKLFQEYQNKPLNDDFYEQLGNLLNVNNDLTTFLKEDGDSLPIRETLTVTKTQLQDVKDEISTVSIEEIKDAFSKIKTKTLFGGEKNLNTEQIGQITNRLLENTNGKNKITIKELTSLVYGDEEQSIKSIFAGFNIQEDTSKAFIERISDKADKSEFFRLIEQYNSKVLDPSRGKMLSCLELINPIIGNKAESASTKMWHNSISAIYKKMNLSLDDMKQISKDEDQTLVIQKLEEFFKEFAAQNQNKTDAEYIQELKKFDPTKQFKDFEKVTKRIQELDLFNSNSENSQFQTLNRIIFGDSTLPDKANRGTMTNAIQVYYKEKMADINVARLKPLVCANFEKRVLNDGLAQYTQNKGEFSGKSIEQILTDARRIVYNSDMSRMYTKFDNPEKTYVQSLFKFIYDKESFEQEQGIIPDIKRLIENIQKTGVEAEGFKGVTPTEKYFLTSDYASQLRSAIKQEYNHKTWLKKFGGMAIGLAAVTLIAQFFFGKIKKEFPENSEGRNK